MKRADGYAYLSAEFAGRVRKKAVVCFLCLLTVPAALVALMFIATGFWEVFLIVAIVALAADSLFVLANGLCHASRYGYAVTGSVLRVRRGVCCRNLSVFRFSDVNRVRVRRYFRKKKVKNDVREYDGTGRSALRFVSETEAVYDVRLFCGSGKYDLKYLSQQAAAAVLSYFEDRDDERAFSKSN